MANSRQATKRAHQAEKRRLRNASQKSELRTAIKKVIQALEAKQAEVANAAFKTATVLIDRLSGRGLLHANKAARIKHRLNKRIKAAV